MWVFLLLLTIKLNSYILQIYVCTLYKELSPFVNHSIYLQGSFVQNITLPSQKKETSFMFLPFHIYKHNDNVKSTQTNCPIIYFK